MAHSTYASLLAALEYIQAPSVAVYYLGAFVYALSVLDKPKRLSFKRRSLSLALMLAIVAAYAVEVLYYFRKAFASLQYQAPKPAALRCLGSILVWSTLVSSLFNSKVVHWHPYLGTFILQFAFETATCLISAITTNSTALHHELPLTLCYLRVVCSCLLGIDGFLVLLKCRREKRTDGEGESLLGKPTTSTSRNEASGYGSIEENSFDGDETKRQQAMRLEQEGGWIGYLQGFIVFLPYLFPRDDWKVMFCFFLRLVHLFLRRALNLLIPRQLGIITDKLSKGALVMPWKDIGLWTLYSWLDSFAGFRTIETFASLVIENAALQKITLLAYDHVLGLSMDFHTAKDSGEVLKAVEQASSLNDLIELVLFQVFPIFFDLVISIYYITHLFDAYLAFIVLYLGFGYLCCGAYFTTLSQMHRRHYVTKRRTENATVNETIHNWQTVSYFNRARHEHFRYQDNIGSTIQAHYSYYYRIFGGRAVQDLVTTFGFAACCILAIWRIVYDDKTVGDLITLIMYWETLTSPLDRISYSYRRISSSLIDAERLLQLLNTKPNVADKEDAYNLVVKEGNVEFKGVDFAYDERKQIIKNASFSAEGGQTVAFVGETGGGKSTMLKLLIRFYDVTSGSITIDGQDLRSVTQSSIRDALGIVPQDPALFNQTIRSNVRYARLDATDSEIEDACRAAAIHDDIVSFPDGYNAKVGERGVRLSGGQLQRIAIARVLLKDPKIVLLDEATSAVDSATEGHIQAAFSKLRKGRTSFVIAHRLSTIIEADQILVVNKGEIVERGTHAELLELGGKYADLWTKQTSGASAFTDYVSREKEVSTCADTKSDDLIDLAPSEEDLASSTTRSESSGDGDHGRSR